MQVDQRRERIHYGRPTSANWCMISRIDLLLKKMMLALVVAGLLLVPLWQSVGHATESQHAFTAAEATVSSTIQSDLGLDKHDHHAVSDHAHDVPVLQFVTIKAGRPSAGDWVPGLELPFDGVTPQDPQQPPRSI